MSKKKINCKFSLQRHASIFQWFAFSKTSFEFQKFGSFVLIFKQNSSTWQLDYIDKFTLYYNSFSDQRPENAWFLAPGAEKLYTTLGHKKRMFPIAVYHPRRSWFTCKLGHSLFFWPWARSIQFHAFLHKLTFTVKHFNVFSFCIK